MLDFNKIQISVYNGVRDNVGTITTLHDFLTNVDSGTIELLRATQDPDVRKQLKLTLPQGCISGIFSPKRSVTNLVKHSGLICVDIDRKDNTHIPNFDTLIDDLFWQLDNVAYASRSVSGGGYFLIVPLAHPDQHREQFDQLIRDFKDMGLNIDRVCGDVCRLRCQSSDPNAFFNPHAIPFEGIYTPPPRSKYHQYTVPVTVLEGDTIERVHRMCVRIEREHIDLTTTYDDWFRVGAALASLGEIGRKYFHLCSRQNPKYRYEETDRKFTSLLHSPSSRRMITIATFFFLCTDLLN